MVAAGPVALLPFSNARRSALYGSKLRSDCRDGRNSYVLERARQLENSFDSSGISWAAKVSNDINVLTIMVTSSMLKDTCNVG